MEELLVGLVQGFSTEFGCESSPVPPSSEWLKGLGEIVSQPSNGGIVSQLDSQEIGAVGCSVRPLNLPGRWRSRERGKGWRKELFVLVAELCRESSHGHTYAYNDDCEKWNQPIVVPKRNGSKHEDGEQQKS